MKHGYRMVAAGALAAAMFCSVANDALASACRLRNEDSNEYQVKITQDGGTTDKTIGGNTETPLGTGKVEIEVVGVGKVTADDDDVVTIRDGKVTVKEG